MKRRVAATRRLACARCGSCRRVCGTGRRRIRTGSRRPGGPDGWPEVVSSYAIDDGERLLLIDPLDVPSQIEELAAKREPAVVLTCPWHERDARNLAVQLAAPVFVPPPDAADKDPLDGQVFSVGDRLPGGVEAFAGYESNDHVLWVEARQALVLGDTLVTVAHVRLQSFHEIRP